MEKKACYWVTEDDETGVAIVATSYWQAKKFYQKSGEYDYGNPIEEIQCRVMRKVNVNDLPIGHILETVEGLQRGAYGYSEVEAECPICHEEKDLRNHDGVVVCCFDCYDKIEENKVVKDGTQPSEHGR